MSESTTFLNCSWENVGLTLAAITLASGSMICVLCIFCILNRQINSITNRLNRIATNINRDSDAELEPHDHMALRNV